MVILRTSDTLNLEEMIFYMQNTLEKDAIFGSDSRNCELEMNNGIVSIRGNYFIGETFSVVNHVEMTNDTVLPNVLAVFRNEEDVLETKMCFGVSITDVLESIEFENKTHLRYYLVDEGANVLEIWSLMDGYVHAGRLKNRIWDLDS